MRLSPIIALGFGLVVTARVPPAHADEPIASLEPPAPPAADLPPEGARTTHLVAGLVTTGLFYGAAVGASYLAPDEPGASELRLPIAGPWLALAETGCAKDEPDCSLVLLVIRAALTVVDGVGQVGGLGLIGEGLFLKTAAKPATRPKAVSLRAVPLEFGRDGVGLGLVGTF